MSQKILFNNQQKSFGPLLQLNDRLREVLRDIQDVNVSTIIVVGDQSHGKTSVIERLTSISLPRGNRIATRAPTEIRIASIEANEKPIHTLQYKTGAGIQQIQFELHQLADLVSKAQTEMTGNDWDISFEPIYIEIQKQNHKDMTIIDLPGVTRVLQKGVKDNIEQKILKLYEKYMEPEQTIIINISNIMVDLDTSASFQLSNKLDPDGSRTVLCFTKIDQFREKGIKQKIEYQIDKFNINIDNVFLIRNRTQEEADDSKDLEYVAQEEIELLNSNVELKEFPDSMKGIQALSQKVVTLQKEKIIVNLNQTHKKLKNKLIAVNKESLKIGKNFNTIQEITQKINQGLNEIMAKIQNHYNCINVDSSYFEEKYYAKKIMDDSFVIDPKSIHLKCEVSIESNRISFRLQSKKSSRIKIELRDVKTSSVIIKNINLIQDKQKSIEVIKMDQFEKFFVKVILYKNQHGDNIFSKFWQNEDVFINGISNLFQIKHFFNKEYIQSLNKLKIQLGKGFDSISDSNQNYINTILKFEVLPSLDKQCLKLQELNYEYILEDILQQEFNETFKEYPFLQEEIMEIVERFMKNQNKIADNLLMQILEWGKSCYTQNILYQEIIDNLVGHFIQFVSEYEHIHNIHQFEDRKSQSQYINLYKESSEIQESSAQLWKEFQEEVRAVFSIWSYWQVNLLRIKESLIPMLRFQFIEQVKEKIFKEIMDQLQEYDEQTIKDLVRPDKKTEIKRQKLEKKKKMLEKAISLIEQFCKTNPMYRRKILKKIAEDII